MSIASKKPRVFISYSRKDGEDYATELREKLLNAGIPLWQDRVGMEGGKDWWHQIRDALDNVEFMVLVMTPEALKSDVIRKEWRYARLQGVCVYPVKGVPDDELGYSTLPRWMRDMHWYTLEHEWQKFTSDLNTKCDTPRVPFMCDDLPDNFVNRPDEFEDIINQILNDEREEPVAITAALRGAGGFGKTTLARAICHDDRVQQAFDDGILWVTLGEDVSQSELISKLLDLIETLSGERPQFENLEATKTRFVELLADRDMLIVIDDAWKASHTRPFTQGGERCTRLITTRDESTLPSGTQKIVVESMKTGEAVELLSSGLEAKTDEKETLNDLAEKLGEWALILKITNGVIKERVEREQTLAQALDHVYKVLDKRGIFGLNLKTSTDDRREAAQTTLDLSLESLDDEDRKRAIELAIFPEDVNIPLLTVTQLWNVNADLDDLDTEELCERLFDRSLLVDYSLTEQYIRLHDVVRAYLIRRADNKLPSIHQALLEQYKTHYSITQWSDLPNDEPYLWDWLAYHLTEALQRDELVQTVKDLHYIAKKTYLRQIFAVESDLQVAELQNPDDQQLARLTRIIVNAGHVLNQCETADEVLLTLRYRLEHSDLLTDLLPDSLQPATPRIEPIVSLKNRYHSALYRTLSGHRGYINVVSISHNDRYIASGSNDRTVKVWDAQSGLLLHNLEGHVGRVNVVSISHNDRYIASGSHDRTIKVWDAQSGLLLHNLEGHSRGRVNVVSISHNDRYIASGSYDRTIKVWDAQSGLLLHNLEGHVDKIETIAISHNDRYIVSGSYDRTIKVWDAQSGLLLHNLEGHVDKIETIAISHNDRYIASGSYDQTIKVWDAQSGLLLHNLEGHIDKIETIAISHNDRYIVSGSHDRDRTIKVWDAQSGLLLHNLEGHIGKVNVVSISHNDRYIVSGSHDRDRTIKVWDAQSGLLLHNLEGHTRSVSTVAISHNDHYIVSGSHDHTIKVWDAQSIHQTENLAMHNNSIYSLAVSHDDQFVVSGSSERTVKVWDAQSGLLLHNLDEHTSSINSIAISHNDHFIVSASRDSTIKVWDTQSGLLLHDLEGHTRSVITIAISHNDRFIVSGSHDRTIKVWDAQSGVLIQSLRGHGSGINDIAISHDNHFIVSASKNHSLKVWDMQSGLLIHNLKGHSNRINNVTISHNNHCIISSSQDDNSLKIWDVQFGKLIHDLEGYSKMVNPVKISHNDHFIVSASHTSQKHRLNVWDTQSGLLLHSLEGHQGKISAISISFDERFIISASYDREIKVWEIEHGTCVSTFYNEYPIQTITWAHNSYGIYAGDSGGMVFFLRFVP